MRKRYRTLMSIEFAFVMALIASASIVVIAGLLFGFQLDQWTEWQGVLVGLIGTIAGVIGAALGLRMSFAEKMRLRHHSHHRLH